MPAEKKCPDCNTKFECCNDGNQCWCAELPNVIPLTEGAECLCRECLQKKIENVSGKSNSEN